MKIQNNNAYSIMYGLDFIKAGEVKDIPEKDAKALLKHPNVEEYVCKEQVTALEEENKKLKEQLAKSTAPKKGKKSAKK